MWEHFIETLLETLTAWYRNPHTKLDIQIVLRPDKAPKFHVLNRDLG